MKNKFLVGNSSKQCERTRMRGCWRKDMLLNLPTRYPVGVHSTNKETTDMKNDLGFLFSLSNARRPTISRSYKETIRRKNLYTNRLGWRVPEEYTVNLHLFSASICQYFIDSSTRRLVGSIDENGTKCRVGGEIITTMLSRNESSN